MAENKWDIELGLMLKSNALSNIQDEISTLQGQLKPIEVGINTKQVKSQLNEIKSQIEKLSNIKINLSGEGVKTNSGISETIREINTAKEAYKELMNLQSQIKSKRMSLGKLDTSTNVQEVQELMKQITQLENSYSQLRQKFETKFDESQLNGLKRAAENAARSYSQLTAKMADTSAIKTTEEAYKRLIVLQGQISSTKLSMTKLDVNTNAHEFSELQSRLTELSTVYNQLRSQFNTQFSDVQIRNLDNAIAQTDKDLSILQAKMADTSAIKTVNTSLSELKNQLSNFADMQKKIGNLELKIKGFENAGGNTSQITVLKQQLEELMVVYDETFHTFQKQFRTSNLNTSDFDKLNSVISETDNKLQILEAQYRDTRNELAKDIKSGITDGKMANQISLVETKFKKLTGDTGDLSTRIEKLKSLMGSMDASDDIESVISDYQEYKNILTSVSNQVDIMSRNQQAAAKATAEQQRALIESQKLSQSKTALSSEIDIWLKNNSAAAKEFGAQIEQIKAQIGSADAVKMGNLKAEFQEIKRQAQLAGAATQSMGDRLKAQFEKFSIYFSVSMLISKVIQGLRSMYQQVLSVDTALTELYRVTDLTTNQYENLYDKMTNSAKKYAIQLDTIIASTASWVRLGFNTNVASNLAEITAMYQHVTDLDESTAVKNLVTAYKGFQKSLLQLTNGDEVKAIELISDVYDALGNQFAESAADVGDGLSKAAAVLQQGGTDIQEAAGLFTGIQEVLQDSSVAGSTLKILTLRIRGMKGALEELGEEVDENVDSISKVQTQILNLTHGKVNIFDDMGNFRDIYDIMKEISEIYYDLTDPERASLLEILAGKNRSAGVQALIDNWKQVEKATKAAYEAEGTAAAENEKYLASMQGKLDSLKAAWQSLSNTFLKSSFLKSFITGITKIVNALDKLIDKVGSLPTLLSVVSAALSFKNIGRDKMFSLNYADITSVLFRYKVLNLYE